VVKVGGVGPEPTVEQKAVVLACAISIGFVFCMWSRTGGVVGPERSFEQNPVLLACTVSVGFKFFFPVGFNYFFPSLFHGCSFFGSLSLFRAEGCGLARLTLETSLFLPLSLARALSLPSGMHTPST
jgi:hypothetical protein